MPEFPAPLEAEADAAPEDNDEVDELLSLRKLVKTRVEGLLLTIL